MKALRAIRKAWAAYAGGALFGFFCLMTTPPQSSRWADTAVAIAFVVFGATLALLTESAISRRFARVRIADQTPAAPREPVSVRS
jgi:CDP-diglyceride synthetase